MKESLISFTPWPTHLAKKYRRHGLWKDLPLTELLNQSLKLNGNKTAVICNERKFSYKQLHELSDNLAYNLISVGLKKGDTALVQLPNVAEFLIVFFALIKAGIVPLNAIYKHRQHELNSFITQIKPKLMIVCAQHELFQNDKYLKHLNSNLSLPQVILKLHDTDSDLDLDHWINVKKQSLRTVSLPNHTPPDQVALFQLSGGSTSIPKLIPRTHNDYLYNAQASAELARYNLDTKYLCAMPIAHNFTLSSPGVLGVLSKGGTIIMAESAEPMLCFDLVAKHEINTTSLVPSSVITWINQPDQYINKLKSLKLLHVGGAYFPEQIARQTVEKLQCQLQQVFGMAEGLVNYTSLDDPLDIIVSTQGKPLSHYDEIKIIDEQGNEAEIGETGMLATRGPYTFRGYYKSKEHNQTAFDEDGFYYSGDLVQLTPTGHLKVVGRIKDQINRAGEKIASEEIEEILIKHEDIQNVAIVSIPDHTYIEKTHAFITTNNKNLDITDIRRFLLDKGLSDYKLPDSMTIVENIPLTPIGKPDKKLLRKNFNPRGI
ncbi:MULTISPECIES: (2,3-dihydroxybenzoyl)adenylate synthase [Oligella]|uniref:Enterobactin synthase subunit E n=2 Tax=Oligella urethralis TaxID=90245 RepID=A0A096AKG2_9BURK|nr:MULTISPECIES: AMP-binding protein [Oligella]AVL70586.1 2,3-dihydroxybenzoate-AMP ligase [Oligella urethralis]KGF31162.1 enterobactin synthase subunit E [Oligella urethralis DNF00040]OFV48244.1 2,3-dihydroxybenzoate-AMP ligase [Oligella sp. HMSC09E12]PMC15382.1 2,3-dihydroxybenzoate-AMP ligase [Oligella urethralis]SUA60379.1 2,3-dihydroxybenzoate-AMP ligase [Oligella urethralis]